MSLIDDLIRSLEMRLDAFLQAHPELELQALEEQLRQQELDAKNLLTRSQVELAAVEKKIMTLAEDIKLWHSRIDQAQAAKRSDLAAAARDREANLLQQGNQLWGQMQALKSRIGQMEQLLQQVQVRKQELRVRLEAQRAARTTEEATQRPPNTSQGSPFTESSSANWAQTAANSRDWSQVEDAFRKLEIDEELQRLKQKR